MITTFPSNLDEYFQQYGNDLAEQAARACKPLHVPGRDDAYELGLLRKPFEAQGHVITASIKSLRRQPSLYASAECGVGKTLMAQGVCHGHAKGPYRALVFCPPHMPLKWQREIEETIPNAEVTHLNTYKDVVKLDRRSKPTGPSYWIVASTKAKLGTDWHPAYTEGRYDFCKGTRHNHHQLKGTFYCPRCGSLVQRWDAAKKEYVAITKEELEKGRRNCQECKEPLWQFDRTFDRWPIAKLVHKKLKGFFDYAIIDEAHQTKGATSEIGDAMGSITAACKHTIMLTGTVLGGYAWHVRSMLFRTSPSSLVSEGMTWGNETKFNETYGRIERHVTMTTDLKKAKGKKDENRKTTSRTQKYVRPGVMPNLFGRHLISNMVFLSLDEVAEGLPKLDEQIFESRMDDEQAAEYAVIEKKLTEAISKMMRKKNTSLISKMMHTLLGWPDHPHGWGEIGYYDKDEAGFPVWTHVVTPRNLNADTLRPKEKDILDFCLAERAAGRQTWVYSTMSGDRDCNARLADIFRQHGLRTDVLRSTVETKVREQWIYDRASDLDVCISHPQLVETGLDLFDKKGNHNFSSIAFYQTGYNLFTLRQASRRGWRIGQPLDCKIAYFYYAETLQARAMNLMGRKLSAAQSIEGKFSTEGLAAMAGDEGSIETAMAKSLVERLDDLDVGRTWVKVGAAPREAITEPVATPALAPLPPAPKPMASFSRPGRREPKQVQKTMF